MSEKKKIHCTESFLPKNSFTSKEARKRIHLRLFVLTMYFSFVLITLFYSIALAGTCENWVAKVASVEGTVEAQLAGMKQWQPVKLHDTFCPGDKIRVQERSRADLALVNQPLLRLDANTTITLGGLKEEETTLAGLFKGAAEIDLIKGAAHFFSRLPRNLMVHTAFVNAGVEGTEFFIKVAENETFLSIFEGKVLAANEAGSLPLTSGQSAVAEAGKAPVLRVVARPRDAVRWALYYPPIIIGEPEELQMEGDLRDPRLLTNRAAMQLAVGRVAEATADIERALRLDPKHGNAFALQSIIAVVQNKKDKALDFAQKAVEVDPESAASQIALSYAQQASFDLESTKASLEAAVQLEPENALAWARLAEIRSSFGELDAALAAAQKAVAQQPNLSRTQTVLGFVYLTQVKTTEAKAAFDKAIAFDQADSLPRLGLGLAKIREGDLEEGRREIEIAASLDSRNAIVRSYLGKAYYEEKRSDLDGREYAIAKELDPLDPTPWFYSAIAKQTTNRPVEALHDLQKSKELNDNRAIYRSKLALDSDLAARSASVARIYNDLGFQARGLFEGWMSVNTDPSNYSAHRFLADTYAVLPRHKIARVSELLQSQLLQPTNITPIQPVLGESNLFLISAQGPSNLSFREFNPLFNRNRLALQVTGLYGQYDNEGSTMDKGAGEGIVSGIYNNLSFSAGYSKYDTDGFRINNDQEDEIANVFAQLEITSNTSIQGEFRYRDKETGDTQLRFFADDVYPEFRSEEERKSGRLGFRHAFSPRSTLIGNFSYHENDASTFDVALVDPRVLDGPPPPPYVNAEQLEIGEEEAKTGEIQHLFRSQSCNTVAGAGYFNVEQDTVFTQDVYYPFIAPPNLLFSTFDRAKLDVDHINVYLYSYINYLKNVTFTVGASGDFFEADDQLNVDRKIEQDQFNPKLGVIWNPVPNTTVRGAAFRTLKRTLVADQTLEPTQVAGFNQFFDDYNATKAWVYGGAVDQKFSQNIYGGLEFSKRDMEVPFFFQPSGTATLVVRETDWDEKLGRAYLYWTPHRWFAISAEYLYEKFERDELTGGSEFIKEVKTKSLPLGVNFFHPSGFSVGLKGTYYDQEGVFVNAAAPFPRALEPGEDDFWLVDAAINYRLPKRYGFITVGATNLFDKEFEYADTDIQNPRIQPDRFIFAKVTLAIP